MDRSVTQLPMDVLSNNLSPDNVSIELLSIAQNASEDDDLAEQSSANKTVTEQPASKVDSAIETHMNVMPFFAGGMLILLVAALIMRPGSGKRKAVGNKIVGSAKLLINNGEREAAIEMLNDHLINNPGDDRAKALLKRATAED